MYFSLAELAPMAMGTWSHTSTECGLGEVAKEGVSQRALRRSAPIRVAVFKMGTTSLKTPVRVLKAANAVPALSTAPNASYVTFYFMLKATLRQVPTILSPSCTERN